MSVPTPFWFRSALVFVLVVVSGCDGVLGGLPHDGGDAGPDAGGGPGDGGGFDAGEVGDNELMVFTREVWSLTRADCAGCHQDVRAFAHDEPRVAWAVALPLVRFDSPNASALAVRSENLHCGVAACGAGFGRRARFAEGIRLWGLARGGGNDGGSTTDGGANDAGPQPEPDYTEYLACTPGQPVSEDVARRLSKLQYVNTVRAAFNEAALLSFTSRSNVLHERAWQGALVSAVAQVPEDGEHERLPREDARLTDTHIEGLVAVAQGVVDYYTNQPARLGAIAGVCVLDAAPTEACIRGYISTLLGRRLLSRPLLPAEVDDWYAAYTTGQGSPLQRLLEVTRGFLLHPELVFGLPWQGALVAGQTDVQSLTPFELARRLAWHYTDGPPSNQLYADAVSGALLADAGVLEAHLDGFVAPTGGTGYRFPLYDRQFTFFAFLEQWLDGRSFRGFPSGALSAAAFPGFNFQAGNENWYPEAADELYSFGFRQMYVERGDYADFLNDTRGEAGTFTRRLYGVPTPGFQDLGPSRPGVLSRIGFLASGDVYPNQIIFGVRVIKNVLCQPLPAPDPGALPANFRDLGLRDAHPTWATRAFTAQQTAAPVCQSCHVRINAIGATISRYDGAGGFDLQSGVERVWTSTGPPSVVGTPSLDDAATLALDGALRPVTGLSGLTQAIASSDEGPLCLARTAFTYAMRRRPTPADACFLTTLSNAARNQSLAEAWKELGRNSSFRTRRITPKGP